MADVKISGFEKVEAEIQKRISSSMWEATKAMAEELTPVLQEALRQLYIRKPKSEYYERTGEFADSVYVKPTQGHGTYGLSIRWQEGVIEVHMAPLNKKGKRSGKFNAHADFDGNPIDIYTLVSIEDGRKSINNLLAQTAQKYIDSKGWSAHMSIQNFDEFDFGMFL